MNKHTPLILVDIDGVVNAWDATHPLPAHQFASRAGGHTIILDKRHPEWMAELETRGDVRWATMWQHHAATHFAPACGFGHDWDYVEFDSHHEVRTWRRFGQTVVHYKWAGILAALGEDQPLVYIDDDMAPVHHEWAKMRNSMGVPTLFVQPDPALGLTRKQYESIIQFLDAAVVLTPAELSSAA